MSEEETWSRKPAAGSETQPLFRPGSNVLIRGPSMVGKRALALELLSTLAADERPVVVSAAADSTSVRRRLGITAGSAVSDDCYVVDAVRTQVSGRAMVRTDGGDRRTWYTSSPSDLTGLGISTSRALAATRAEGARPRIVVDSLSTLLLYNSLERLYRFLHVVNGRVNATGGITLQVIHADAHTDQEVAILSHLFDIVVDVATDSDDESVDVWTDSTRHTLSRSELRANA